MRLRKRLLVFGLVVGLGVGGFYVYIRPKYVVPILMYHRIDQQGELSSLSVSPKNFQRQMHFLRRWDYNVLSLAEYVQAKRNQLKMPRNTVVLTFDDGYADNYSSAFPVLKKYNLPATIFVIVDALNQPGYLNYAQIKEMTASGIVALGSHSLSGAYLPGRSRKELEREIGGSKRKLQGQLNKQIELFCYPIGGFSPEIQQILQDYGYQAACTTNRGKAKTYLNQDILALKRIKVTDSGANLFVFWVKLSGHYNLFRRVREPY